MADGPAVLLEGGSRSILVVLSPADTAGTYAAAAARHGRSTGTVRFFAHVSRGSFWGSDPLSFPTQAEAEARAEEAAREVPLHIGVAPQFVTSLAYAVVERGPLAVVFPTTAGQGGQRWRTTPAEALVWAIHRHGFHIACVFPPRHPPATDAARRLYLVAMSPSNCVNTVTGPEAARTIQYVHTAAENGDLVILMAEYGASVASEGPWLEISTSTGMGDEIRNARMFTERWLATHSRRLTQARPGLRVVCEAVADGGPVAAVRRVVKNRRQSDTPVTLVVGYGTAPAVPRWMGNLTAYIRRSSRDALLATFVGEYEVVIT